MLCILREGGKAGWIWRMCGLPTGGKPEPLHRGKFLFVSSVFSKEVRRTQGFKVEIFL